MHKDFMDNGTRERRAHCLIGVVLLLFGVLSVRLYLLQIADWEHYRIQSEKNTMQPVQIEASRGLILDRNGEILVDNRPSYTVSVIPPRLLHNTDPEIKKRTITLLSQIVNLSEEQIGKKLASRKRHFYEPVKLKRDVEFETVSLIEEDRYDLPGVEIQVEARRGYPTIRGEFPLAPHVLGYVGLIDPDQYAQLHALGYGLDDQIGKRGVERICENLLRGQGGLKYIEVNARGREVGSFPEKTQPSISGQDIALTLDWRLQREAEQAFSDTMRGSLVAMDPTNGEILAFVSMPGFHPRSIRNVQEWQALQADPAKPLLNRSIQGEYPPASVLKMVTAIAALEMGLLTADEPRYDPCKGELEFGDRVFRCHHAAGHGKLNLRQALVLSCDVFFYHLGREVGIANWNRYALALGLGQPTGIDIATGGDGEARGLITDRAYYKKHHGVWVEGNMLNLSIGQGETTTTPIQIARYISALAVGTLPQPHILKNTTPRATPVTISEQTLADIRSILQDVVESLHGTGKRARVEGVHVGGKTGTAQNSHGEDHAWFVAFAPVEAPRIVIAVVAENAGMGGEIAAPMARRVLEAYFKTVAPDQKDDITVAARVSTSRKSQRSEESPTLPSDPSVQLISR
ncbi:MAG: penicillin-binding protein 2 [bacterium]|nr:penicillin-binding protein 2 [bacterium]